MLRRANSVKVATFGKVNDPENSQVSKSESRPEVLQISAVVAAKTSQRKHISPPQPQFWTPLSEFVYAFQLQLMIEVSCHLPIFELARC